MTISVGIQEVLAIGLSLFVIYLYVILLGLCVLMYVFHGMSLSAVAKRRGIHKPWLGWIPIGDIWILGCISDQYQLHVKGKRRYRRFLMLGLTLAAAASSLFFMIFALVAPSFMDTVPVTFAVIFTLVYLALAITLVVFFYMSQFDFYRSCDPDNAVVFFLVGMFIDEIQPVFQFVCMSKDLGMTTGNPPQIDDSYCET